MWLIGEIETETGLSKSEVLMICLDNDFKIGDAWGSDGKYLGWKISEEDGDKIVEKYNKNLNNKHKDS